MVCLMVLDHSLKEMINLSKVKNDGLQKGAKSPFFVFNVIQKLSDSKLYEENQINSAFTMCSV